MLEVRKIPSAANQLEGSLSHCNNCLLTLTWDFADNRDLVS